MPSDTPTRNAIERIEPLLERLDLDACLRNLKENWAVNPVDDGDGSKRTQALYTYARPEYAVAQAIADGAAPEDALREWQAAINKMLAEFRPKRRHSLLVEATSALRHAGAPLPGQPTHTPATGTKALETTGGISPIHLALATLAVYQTSDIGYLLSELAASTAPLPGWDKPPQVDVKLIQEGLRISRRAYEALQEEFDLQAKRLAQLEHESSEQRQALETTLANMQTQFKDTQEENELLLLQLHQVQEELERYYLRNLELEKKTSGQQAKEDPTSIKHLERRVHLIEHSTSWRITAPLRFFTRFFFRKGGPPPPPDASAPEDKRIRYLERRLQQLESSTSWKLTAPLRAFGLMFKRRPKTSAQQKS